MKSFEKSCNKKKRQYKDTKEKTEVLLTCFLYTRSIIMCSFFCFISFMVFIKFVCSYVSICNSVFVFIYPAALWLQYSLNEYYVARIGDSRLPFNFRAMHCHTEGNRSRGRQQKKWIDNVTEDLMKQNLGMRRMMDLIRDRRSWKHLCSTFSSTYS